MILKGNIASNEDSGRLLSSTSGELWEEKSGDFCCVEEILETFVSTDEHYLG